MSYRKYNKNDFAEKKTTEEPSALGKIFKETLFLILFIGITILISWVYNKDPGGVVEKTPSLLVIALLAAVTAAFYLNINDSLTYLKSPLFQSVKYIILFVLLLMVSYMLVPKINQASIESGVNNLQMIVYIFIFTGLLFLFMNILLFLYALMYKDELSETTLKYYRSFIFKTLGYFSILSLSIVCIILLFSTFVSFALKYSSTTVGRWIISILIVLIISYLLLKVISMTSFYKKSLLSQFIVDSLFYIPCMIINGFNSLVENLTDTKPDEWVWLCVLVFLLLFYFVYSRWEKNHYSKHGKQLVNMPVWLNQENTLGTYEQIGGNAYQNAISFWFFIDAYPNNYNKAAEKYMCMLNNGEEPTVSYRANENALYFTMRKTVPGYVDKEKDVNGNIIVYKLKNIQYQKWNHVVINYSGGTLDIFYNNVLKQSIPGVVPYMNYDSLKIGENGGIYGSICNVVYFHEALKIQQIDELYEAVYKKTPPVLKVDDNKILPLG